MATKSENTNENAINLADVSAQVEAIIAKAKEEAAQIVAEAKAASGIVETTEEQKKADAERQAYLNELVPVTLFRDNEKYKDDVFVSVNGENRVIKRGERVMIERKFAEVLKQSDLQDFETSKLIERKSSEANAKELN